MENSKKFIFLEHTADMKFQAFGKTLEECFENSALAAFHAMYDGKVKAIIKKRIKAEGKDKENLLYNFLEELLFLLDTEGFFLSKCEVKIKENKINKDKDNKTGNRFELKAELQGDNAKNYSVSLDVKAITYNDMFVKEEKGKFVCQVVLDV